MDNRGFTGNDYYNTSISSSSSFTVINRDMQQQQQQYLKQLNKNSIKISKPNKNNPLPPCTIQIPDPNPLNNPNQTQSHQPPVYTINKDDFRHVVQRLTGSPAPTPPPPPPPTHPRPSSSRLQRIRPPPLAQITNNPPQFTSFPQNDVVAQLGTQTQPYTPLPPLPSVHPAAESPISAYMRFLQCPSPPIGNAPPICPNSDDSQINFTQIPSSSAAQFGCVSLFGLLSPGQLGFPQLPLSPSPPVPSPR